MAYICDRCIAGLGVYRSKLSTAKAVSNGSGAVARTGQMVRYASRYSRAARTDARQLKRLPFARLLSTAHNTVKPFRLAIIGSGPAGFYTASRIMRQNPDARVDMYERLQIPFGLVRYGVAPDHPEVKNCQERFEEVAESPNFEFCGNLDVGGQIPLEVIKQNYDAILFAYGAAEDRELGIEGEHLKGVWSARSFVAWYNGLPGYAGLDFGLGDADFAAIIGQGNVSLDVARILLTPVDVLRKTDIPEYALEALSRSSVKRVEAIGRRGPLQAAFTIKEIRELTAIPNVHFAPVDNEFFPKDLKSLPRARRRIAELLIKASKAHEISNEPMRGMSEQRRFMLKFMESPIAFRAESSSPGRLHSILLRTQQFAKDTDQFSPSALVESKVEGEQDSYELENSLCFRSIGYKSTPLPGLLGLGIDFDQKRGVIPNDNGRAIQLSGQPGVQLHQALAGLYVAGWVKRGPTGVIASTMEDAFATADCVNEDIAVGKPFMNGKLGQAETGNGWQGVMQDLQQQGLHLRKTGWSDWKKIAAVERARGKSLGKEREKITDVKEMLELLD